MLRLRPAGYAQDERESIPLGVRECTNLLYFDLVKGKGSEKIELFSRRPEAKINCLDRVPVAILIAVCFR
jgi:hypothetical protein